MRISLIHMTFIALIFLIHQLPQICQLCLIHQIVDFNPLNHEFDSLVWTYILYTPLWNSHDSLVSSSFWHFTMLHMSSRLELIVSLFLPFQEFIVIGVMTLPHMQLSFINLYHILCHWRPKVQQNKVSHFSSGHLHHSKYEVTQLDQ